MWSGPAADEVRDHEPDRAEQPEALPVPTTVLMSPEPVRQRWGVAHGARLSGSGEIGLAP